MGDWGCSIFVMENEMEDIVMSGLMMTPRPLRVGSRGLGYELICRLQDAGATVLTKPEEVPPLPNSVGFLPALEFDYGGHGGIHSCKAHMVEVIPAVLVCDLEMPHTVDGMWKAKIAFRSYWLWPVSLLHEGGVQALSSERKLSVWEAYCLVAQYRFLGSAKFFCHSLRGQIGEVAVMPNGVDVEIQPRKTRVEHHDAYAPNGVGTVTPYKSVTKRKK